MNQEDLDAIFIQDSVIVCVGPAIIEQVIEDLMDEIM